MAQEKTLFATQLTDHQTTQQEFPLGCKRNMPDDKEPPSGDAGSSAVNVAGYLYRERIFRYVQNISGGALVKDALVQADGLVVAAVSASAGTTTTVTRASGSFVSDLVKVGDIIGVLDDAGAAGAAPEGEIAVVTKVTALVVTFAPALTAAIAASDTVEFHRPWTIKASVAGETLPGLLVGIPMVDIANGEFGWIQTRGSYPNANVVAAGTAVAKLTPLYSGTALLTPVGPALTEGTPNILIAGKSYAGVAWAVQGLSSDTVRRKALVFLHGE